ncbi:DUF6541 family protein [Arthrobacter zhaoguopingii]|uniref:DUF6541 family protein n=1 Tax=Arthrobacter zhaoguopingii TaxID=2681491 RepID=UPI0013582AA7|nr:DUF6541 family protein [Arthrobacter zhaoguopingii]
MSWWTTVPVLAATLAVMVLPGAVVGLAMGFRRLVLVGVAPMFSVAVAGIAAVLASLAGIPWGILPLLGVTLVVAAIGLVLDRVFRSRMRSGATIPPDGWRVVLAALVGVGTGALLIARQTKRLIGRPEEFAQRFDNIFHLNAVRYILETGDASTLTLASLTGNTGAAAAYPAAWHSFAALVSQLSGASVPLSVNFVNIVTASVVWPLSVLFLARVVIGPRHVGLLSAGVLSAAFVAFPFLMMIWGPLFPYMLSLAIVPAALALVVLAVNRGNQIGESRWRSLLGLGGGLAGIGFSHTSSVNTLIALSLPLLVTALVAHLRDRVRRKAPVRGYIPAAAMVVLAAPLMGAVWLKLRPGPYDTWSPHTTSAGAIGEVIANAPLGMKDITAVASILAIIGVVSAVRNRTQFWFVVSAFIAGYLYFVDASFEKGYWRALLTGIWYQDTHRLAAIVPVVAVVLAGLGCQAVADAVLKSIRRRKAEAAASPGPAGRARTAAGAGGLALVALLLTLSNQTGPVGPYIDRANLFYQRESPTSILSNDEYELLERIQDEVPEDAVIAGNPWNGSTLVYAFEGLDVLAHHLIEVKTDEEIAIAEGLRDATTSETVCEAIREEGVTHVLDFGTQYLSDNSNAHNFPGLEGLESSDAVELVDREGAAKLYKVTVCQPED